MSQSHPRSPETRALLRQRWLERSGAAFDRMLADDQHDQLVTFTQREDRACDR